MNWQEALQIRGGVTAIIGSGGKTTLLRTLGEELAAAGKTVLLCTTTKMYPFAGLPCLVSPAESTLEDAAQAHRLLCVGAPVPGTEKLTAPELPVDTLARFFQYVLVEADGSAQRPLKAHAAWEPVVPRESNQTICVVGLSGLGLPIEQAAHRPEQYARLAMAALPTPVTPELAARVLRRELLADRYLLNQADTPERWEWGRRLADELSRPVVIGSLQKGECVSCLY